MAISTEKKKTVEFANFTCKFGEHDMLDFASLFVIPAFLDEKAERKVGNDTVYFLHDTQIIEIVSGDRPVIAIVGRFIKDTILRREQIWNRDAAEVEKAPLEFRSSPSALFVLILNTHKLLYYPEVADAPMTESFRSTITKFIRDKREIYIDTEYRRRTEDEQERRKRNEKVLKRTTWATIHEEYPLVTLEIIPLGSSVSLASFVRQFSKLNSIEIDLIEPNQEGDYDEWVAHMRQKAKKVGADKARLSESSTKGLDKDEAILQLEAAAQQGNMKVTMTGKNAEGLVFRGDNDSFKLKVPIDQPPATPSEAGKPLFDLFKKLQNEGIFLPDQDSSDESTSRLREIQRQFIYRNE